MKDNLLKKFENQMAKLVSTNVKNATDEMLYMKTFEQHQKTFQLMKNKVNTYDEEDLELSKRLLKQAGKRIENFSQN